MRRAVDEAGEEPSDLGDGPNKACLPGCSRSARRRGKRRRAVAALAVWLTVATLADTALCLTDIRFWQWRALVWQDPRARDGGESQRRRLRAIEADPETKASHAAAAAAALEIDDWEGDMPAIPLDASAQWVEVEVLEQEDFSLPSQEELMPLKDPEVAKHKGTAAAIAREAAKAHIERLKLKQPLQASHRSSKYPLRTLDPAKAAALKAIGMASLKTRATPTWQLPAVTHVSGSSVLTRPEAAPDSPARETTRRDPAPNSRGGTATDGLEKMQQLRADAEPAVEMRGIVADEPESPQPDVTPEDLTATPPWFAKQGNKQGGQERAGGSQEGSGDSLNSRRTMRKQRSSHSSSHNSVKEEWLKLHRTYLKDVAKAQEQNSPWDVVFYGDSIVEEYRGTFLGGTWGPFQLVHDVWEEFFGNKPYKAYAMGIAGDTVRKLLWRLQHGELPRAHPPKVVVLHIGTNDIVGNCSQAMAQGVGVDLVGAIKYLFNALPRTHVVTLGILPKGEVWPNRCSPAIDTANLRLKEVASRNQRVHFLDYSSSFLSQMDTGDKYEIRESLMPDSMHPSHVGMKIIASQLEPFIRQLLAGFPPDSPLTTPAAAHYL